jgi:hypothetical protein
VPFFLRRVAFASWQGQSPVNDEQRAAGRRDFVLSDADTDGLSVFEVQEDVERRLIVAAIACRRRNLANVDLLEIADAEIRTLGEVVQTPGDYPVARANRLHRSLPWEQSTLNALADRLLDAPRRAARYRRADVKAAVTSLTMEDVDSGPYREWLASVKAEAP